MLTPKDVQAIVTGEDSEDVKYNEKGVQDLRQVKETISAIGLPPLKFRKLNGILTALEMQIEDFDYDIKVVQSLGNALIRLAEIHGSKQQSVGVSKAFKKFIGTLDSRKSGQGFGK